MNSFIEKNEKNIYEKNIVFKNYKRKIFQDILDLKENFMNVIFVFGKILEIYFQIV